MKVLMISLDGSILDKNSKSASRMKDYGSVCDELYIIILGTGGENLKLTDNIYIYPAGRSRFLSLFKAKQIGEKILSKHNDWIITAQDPFETGFIGWRLAKKFGVGLEVQLHGDFYGNNYWKKEKIINRFRWHLGRFVLKRAAGVRVVSERIRESIGNFAKGKIYEIPVCASIDIKKEGDVDFLKNKFPGAFPIILAVGNLVPVKNHEFLLEVFAEIKKKLPKAKLVIVGGGPLSENLRFKISNLKLENDVELAGRRNNLADYYGSADIFAHPSFYEGWGRAIVEAAHFGLPIVMSDVGLAGEVIINNKSGLVVPVDNRGELIDAVIKLAGDRDLRERFKKEAAEAIKNLPDNINIIKNHWQSISA